MDSCRDRRTDVRTYKPTDWQVDQWMDWPSDGLTTDGRVKITVKKFKIDMSINKEAYEQKWDPNIRAYMLAHFGHLFHRWCQHPHGGHSCDSFRTGSHTSCSLFRCSPHHQAWYPHYPDQNVHFLEPVMPFRSPALCTVCVHFAHLFSHLKTKNENFFLSHEVDHENKVAQ